MRTDLSAYRSHYQRTDIFWQDMVEFELRTFSSVTPVKGENMYFVIYGRGAQRKPLSLDLAFKKLF